MKKILSLVLALLMIMTSGASAYNPARFEGVENITVNYDPANPTAYSVKAGLGSSESWSQFGGHMVIRYLNAGKQEEIPLMLVYLTTSGVKAAQMEIRTDAHLYQAYCTDLASAGLATLDSEGVLLVTPNSAEMLRDMAQSAFVQVKIWNDDPAEAFSFLLPADSRALLNLFLDEYEEEILPKLTADSTLTAVYNQLTPAVSAQTAPEIGEDVLNILNGEYTTLQSGSYGDAVLRLQKALDKLGFLYYKADGMYGKHTVRSVREFQESIGMTGTGVADPATQLALYLAAAGAT